MSRYKADDVDLLLPTFRPVAKRLLAAMTAWGFKPVPFDTVRTAAEAARNAKRGTGSSTSMHLYGCAMDVICEDHGWDCGSKKCDFYEALGREAESLKLVWGGRWAMRDLPHVQALPVTWQPQMRALGTEPITESLRDQLVAKYFRTKGTP